MGIQGYRRQVYFRVAKVPVPRAEPNKDAEIGKPMICNRAGGWQACEHNSQRDIVLRQRLGLLSEVQAPSFSRREPPHFPQDISRKMQNVS
jgi:hypothetical protein